MIRFSPASLISRCGFALMCSTLQAVAGEGEVLLYNWSGYIAPDAAALYQERFGLQLVVDTYDLSDEAEARLSAGGTGYDVAVVGSETIRRLMESGALMPREMPLEIAPDDPARQMRDALRAAIPGVQSYAVPYLWGTTGLVYDRDAVLERLPDAPLDSWALIFDPKNAAALEDCGLSIVDSVEEVVPAALAYLGKDPNSKVPEEIAAAFDVLRQIAPYVRSFDTDQYDDVTNGEICAAISWSSDGLGRDPEGTGADYRYVTPVEGANFWVDLLVIPKDAPDPERAAELVDFILSPEVLLPSADYAGACSSISYAEGMDTEAATSCADLAVPAQSNLYFLQSRDAAEKAHFDSLWRLLQIEG